MVIVRSRNMFEVLMDKPLEVLVWAGIAFLVGCNPLMFKLMSRVVWDRIFPPK